MTTSAPALAALFAPKTNKYLAKFKPSPKQLAFLWLNCLEAMYGGAAGGGKSFAELMAALQYVDVPGYSALLLRRTFPELEQANGLIPVSKSWLAGTDAKWSDKKHRWTFPSGATLQLGHIEYEDDKYNYDGSQFQYIGFDETTGFTESMYRYMFSRLRAPIGLGIPLRMRAASNPGKEGHEWVKQRFITEGRQNGRVFIPATIDDNPYLDKEAYVKSLDQLDPLTRAQLLKGDWSVRPSGARFKREWFEVIETLPASISYRWFRFWDMAATEADGRNDPDWTRGIKGGLGSDGVIYIVDLKSLRGTPGANKALIVQTAKLDGTAVKVRMEQEPGSSGKTVIADYAKLLLGFDFQGIPSTGDKITRANPLSSAAQAGNVKLLRGAWISTFLDELEAFPEAAHDDIVDATSGMFNQAAQNKTAGVRFL